MTPLVDEQMRTLNAVCDRLVPEDGSGGGALEIGAAIYIVRALEADYSSLLPLYRHGLRTLDGRARERHGKAFASLDGPVQDSLLRELESEPVETAERVFFETVRNHTIEGMFGDPKWGGNRDYAGWKMIGYKRPRLVWSQADQEITALPASTEMSAQIRDQR